MEVNFIMNTSINVEDLRSIPQNEPFVCMYSGGKDCAVALSIACRTGIPVALIHSVNEKGYSNYHNQSLDLVKNQAIAMGLQIATFNGNIASLKYLVSLTRLLMEYSKKNVKTLVLGTTYDLGTYKILKRICDIASFNLKCPLWGVDPQYILKEMANNHIVAKITTINVSQIPISWLGQIYNQKTYLEFLNLNIDPLGENNEFHTTLIDSDMFVKKLTCEFFYENNMNSLKVVSSIK